MTYTVDKALECLQKKVQKAINEFHEESGHVYVIDVDVSNIQANTIGEGASKYTSMVTVSAEIQRS
ncbi:hypothetical protein ACRYJU_07455 [Alloalcanivorax xenomutans]|uniref:hypothetical protein n=1 Tax=Alloalcanivorax xenomutans TaxID=1094342 RepID=UPI003D9BD3B3